MTSKALKRQLKHRAIIKAALEEFATQGYSGASVEAIAKGAGVSKPTLYQYVGNKEALFQAVLKVEKTAMLAPLQANYDEPMVAKLWQFSWHYAQLVLRPDMLSIARLIIGEAQRLPEVAANYQQQGPQEARQGIIDYLQGQAKLQRLVIEDPNMAAENLWSLILSASREHLLHYPDEQPDANKVEHHIRHGLMVFIRAFSTNTETDLYNLEQQLAPPQPFH